MKGGDGLELKAADLQYHPRVVSRALDEADGWSSNVAADERCSSAGCEKGTCQCRRGRLSVGAGDCNGAAFQESSREFKFANHGSTAFDGTNQLRHIHRHAGADDNEVLFAEGAFAVLSGLDPDTVIEQS